MQKGLEVTIKGITPLLVSKMGIDEGKLKHISQNPLTSEDIEILESRLYKRNGYYCFPFTWVMEAIKAMSKREKEPGKRGGSYFKTIAAAVQIEPEWIDMKTSPISCFGRYLKTKMRNDRVWAESPKFDEWQATFTISVDTSIIKPELVKHFLEEAGRLNGVGAWRPERGGRFGKFTVT